MLANSIHISFEFAYRSKSVLVAMEVPGPTLCWKHLRIYIAKKTQRSNLPLSFTVFVKKLALTRSNSLMTHLVLKRAVLESIFVLTRAKIG